MYDRQVDNITTEAEKEALSKIHVSFIIFIKLDS